MANSPENNISSTNDPQGLVDWLRYIYFGREIRLQETKVAGDKVLRTITFEERGSTKLYEVKSDLRLKRLK